MKKFKSLVLTVIGLLCCVSVSAHDFEVDGIYYNITSNLIMDVEVTYKGSEYKSYSDEYSGAVSIPESVTYNGSTYRVSYIGYQAFADCSGVTSVVIPNGVWLIHTDAFDGCSGLTSVVIPNSVKYIGSGAFSYCSSLTSVEIPNSVTEIKGFAFYDCSSLTSVEIPNSVTSIGEYAFSGCSSLTSLVVAPDNPIYDSREGCNAIVKTSNNELIAGCKSTIIPNSVTNIGESAFDGCSGLTSVVIPNSVTNIGKSAFYDCSGLTSVVIHNSVTNIEEYAFSGCYRLTSVKIPNSVEYINSSVFSGCYRLTSVEIPNSVTHIWEQAFYGCSGLTSMEIPNSVIWIADGVFHGCSGLTSVKIPNSVGYIGKQAFKHCRGLTSIEIPNSVTTIWNEAFYGCSGLTSVEIPNSVTSIGDNIFGEVRLRTIVSKSNNPARCYDISQPFSNHTYIHAPLYVPEGAYWNYAYANGWGDFIHIKEMVMTEEALLSNKAYMIADSKGTNFKVYDAEKDALKNVEYTHALDEESEDCCWTVMKENGNTYLYNLGAKKFGVVGNNGAITLSETPVHVAISETEGGLSINGNNCMFVLNKHVEVDATGVSDVLLNGQDVKNAQIHSLDGRRQQTLKRGVNIVNGKKVFGQ